MVEDEAVTRWKSYTESFEPRTELLDKPSFALLTMLLHPDSRSCRLRCLSLIQCSQCTIF